MHSGVSFMSIKNIYGNLLSTLWAYIHVCVSSSPLLCAWVPLSLSRQRITCLGAMRPCIRQVELQGEFCNTWPVSLSHLCGWRKRGKDEEGESKRGSRGQGSWGGGPRKRLGVIGGMSDNEKWLREGARRTAGGAGGRRNEMTAPSYFFFLAFSLSVSFSHPSLHPCPSFLRLPGRPGWVAALLITHPFNLKGHKHKLSASKCRNIKLLRVAVVAFYWLTASLFVPVSACVVKKLW